MPLFSLAKYLKWEKSNSNEFARKVLLTFQYPSYVRYEKIYNILINLFPLSLKYIVVLFVSRHLENIYLKFIIK